MPEPKLLATTLAGKSSRCVREVLNSIMPRDPEVEVTEVCQNVLVVRSNLLPNEVYGTLRAAPPSCLARAYPVHTLAPLNEVEAIRASLELVGKYQGTFLVDCVNRGAKVDCRQVEMGIGMMLGGRVSYGNPDWVLTVNCADMCYISVLRRGQEKFRSSLPMSI
ncbi:RNA methyltransferase [Sulfodiicoccus acidiphilus]|uniref:RNA methyltransferase n=1 Tax=Sulfodiicoccus acidiphilus TaxID=1670455 RepID=A0A348B320_9CREN|nr:THUMP domain-containing protein [Sulfodiicoccus acidiphilus]BBD72572.1 RNA methyltransferase [Sulfodiicoccus acidiphilus]GGT93586.1 RNA methyltransferase [Sulfodiicoccus acidiphilus]